MSEQRHFVRRTVRRLRYDDNGSTVDVSVVVRPSRPPPSIPGTVSTPPSPSPNTVQFPINQRFMETINRAVNFVDEGHPLHSAASVLTRLSRQPRTGPPHRLISRPKIIYDLKKFENNSDDNPEKCPICIAEYEEGDECGVLPCKHTFHDECIRTWTNTNRTCPLCRLSLE